MSILERCPSYNGVREERVDCIPLGGEGLGGICNESVMSPMSHESVV